MSTHAPSGLDLFDELPWGSHICQFFRTHEDLRDTLVPYFKAGLENDERCLLVAMDPFGTDDARSALRSAVPDFDRREKAKQIEIHDVRAWYDSTSVINGADIVAGLLRSEEQARSDGYAGLRTNGNIGWVRRHQWAGLQDYETQVTRALKGRRMISMCSYCLDSCTSQDVLDVIFRHDSTIGKSSHDGSMLARPMPEQLPHRASDRAAADKAATGKANGSTELQLRSILEAIPAAIYTANSDGYLTYYNDAAARLWGQRPEIGKQRWSGAFRIVLLDGTIVPHDECPMATAIKTGQPIHGLEVYIERPDGTRIPCAPFPTPMFDEHGRVAGAINMLVDISQQKAIQDRQSFLMRELDHRIKNNLATVQAIAGSTMRTSRSMEEFQRTFTSRIAALSRTHSLLTDEKQSHVSVRQLMANELDIYADGDGQRVIVSGPDVVLPARIAVSFGMAVHELTTNALKHGALSMVGGKLAVDWRQIGSRIEFEWNETNVRIAGQPTRVGFGTQLLKRLLPVQLGAEVKMEFEPDGLKAAITLPLA
jgi:PAS domain S-box-containing protein